VEAVCANAEEAARTTTAAPIELFTDASWITGLGIKDQGSKYALIRQDMHRLLSILTAFWLLVLQPDGLHGQRATPPQPRQQQGLEYFAGSWTFTYTGRESAVSPGPREGTMTFTRSGSTALDVRTEGRVDGGSAFKETATFEWNETAKVMTMKERLWNGTELTITGDWSSPLSIRAESQPVTVGKQSVRVRRVYTMLSAQSFALAEEISIDGGPFQRLGNGEFSRRTS
jgi:hypothetical protein